MPVFKNHSVINQCENCNQNTIFGLKHTVMVVRDIEEALGPRWMAQCVICLLYKHGNSNSVPRTQGKSGKWWQRAEISRTALSHLSVWPYRYTLRPVAKP